MRFIPPAAQAALEAGEAVAGTAVEVLASDAPFRVWSGEGALEIDGETFLGVGDRGAATSSPSAQGGAANGLTLELSGVDPDTAALVDSAPLVDAPVTLWRLVFNAAGTVLLGAFAGARGRADGLTREEVPADPIAREPGRSTLKLQVEGSARGLGRRGGRMRSDADQRLIDPNDGAFKHVAYAANVELAWGGKAPARASAVLPGVTGPTSGGGGLVGGGGAGGGGFTGFDGRIV